MAELTRSEMRCEYVFRDALMRRKPRITGATVTLAGVHLNISINVLTATVNDVFTLKALVLLQRFIRLKAACIDDQRLLLAVGQRESNPRFSHGFHQEHVSLTAATICEDKYWKPVFSKRTPSARRQVTRARRLVALVAFGFGFYVEFVDLNQRLRWIRGASSASCERWTRR